MSFLSPSQNRGQSKRWAVKLRNCQEFGIIYPELDSVYRCQTFVDHSNCLGQVNRILFARSSVAWKTRLVLEGSTLKIEDSQVSGTIMGDWTTLTSGTRFLHGEPMIHTPFRPPKQRRLPATQLPHGIPQWPSWWELRMRSVLRWGGSNFGSLLECPGLLHRGRINPGKPIYKAIRPYITPFITTWEDHPM